MMDPIGLGFEHFDGAGLWRDAENGREIDDSGEVVGTDVSGPFQGAVDLAHKLAKSDQVRDCLTLSMFRYAYGRSEAPEDDASLRVLRERFASGNLRDLLVALTETDAFLYLPTQQATAKEGAQ
jgi:hypothetical protein